jgi:hypothetical protein
MREHRDLPQPVEHSALVRPAAFPQTELIIATNSSQRREFDVYGATR